MEKGILNGLNMMKNFSRFLIFLSILIMTSSCLRLATLPTVDLSQFTPQPSPSGSVQAVSPGAPTRTATQELDLATLTTLRLFPLWVGSTWVYEYMGYTQEEEAHWRVTETVISSMMMNGFYVVEVERKIELTLGDPGEDFPLAPSSGTFFYLVDGKNVYRFDQQPDTDLASAWLALVLPFPSDGEAWYPNPVERARDNPAELGSRMADGPFDQVVSESGTRTCYNVVTQVEKGVEEATFCEGIGYLFAEGDNNSGEGYRMEMIGFLLQ